MSKFQCYQTFLQLDVVQIMVEDSADYIGFDVAKLRLRLRSFVD